MSCIINEISGKPFNTGSIIYQKLYCKKSFQTQIQQYRQCDGPKYIRYHLEWAHSESPVAEYGIEKRIGCDGVNEKCEHYYQQSQRKVGLDLSVYLHIDEDKNNENSHVDHGYRGFYHHVSFMIDVLDTMEKIATVKKFGTVFLGKETSSDTIPRSIRRGIRGSISQDNSQQPHNNNDDEDYYY